MERCPMRPVKHHLTPGFRECLGCGNTPLQQFSKNSKGRYQSRCKKCMRRYHIKKRKMFLERTGVPQAVAYRITLRKEVLQYYGGIPPSCACCGETLYEFLSIDHKEGGGSKHRKNLKNRTVYCWLRQQGYPPGFRVLCHNCNQSIGVYGYCPHKA
jgi:hypothetical protein